MTRHTLSNVIQAHQLTRSLSAQDISLPPTPWHKLHTKVKESLIKCAATQPAILTREYQKGQIRMYGPYQENIYKPNSRIMPQTCYELDICLKSFKKEYLGHLWGRMIALFRVFTFKRGLHLTVFFLQQSSLFAI